MGRRSKFEEAALRAAIDGQQQFICFNKSRLVSDWLTKDQLKDPKKNLELMLSRQSITPQPNPRTPNAEPIPIKDTKYSPDYDPCFIIANGESRRGFDLNKLKDKGYIIGMNVLPIAENFWPDALVSVDIATVKWISERDVPDKLEMWSYPRGGVKDPRIVRFPKDWGWSSGPTATRMALEYKYFKKLYILGMDFFGMTKTGEINEKNGTQINNMYKGHARYRQANASRTYFGNWLNQMVTNVQNHPTVKFYHIIRPKQTSPANLLAKSNWIDITYDQFDEHLQKMAKKES